MGGRFVRGKRSAEKMPGRAAGRKEIRAFQGYSEEIAGGPPEEIAEALSESLEVPASLFYFHSAFEGGVQWRLTRRGVEVEGAGIERTRGAPATVRRAWADYGDSIDRWGVRYGVPAELILAAICTESGGRAEPVRIEPGYESDEATPGRVSPGLMQTLISTAREALAGEVTEEIDRSWLLEPDNSIRAGTAYIARQKPMTGFDPPKVACAYNAGGVYRQTGAANRWKMRQYPIGTSAHADRFVKWLNDFFSLTASGGPGIKGGFYETR